MPVMPEAKKQEMAARRRQLKAAALAARKGKGKEDEMQQRERMNLRRAAHPLLLLALGFTAFNQGTVAVPVVDNLINKFM